MSEPTPETTISHPPVPSLRSYARVIGWLYFSLGVTGLFTDNLWHMFALTHMIPMLYMIIGLSGLIVAGKAGLRAHQFFNLFMGTALTVWGVMGTLMPQLFSPLPLPLDNALHVVSGLWGFYAVATAFWKG